METLTDKQIEIIRAAYDSCEGEWTGCDWTATHGRSEIDLGVGDPASMHAAADRIDAGTFYADDDLDGVPVAISAERMDLLHRDGYDGDEEAAAAARLRIWASDLRSGADWLEACSAAAAAAEERGRQAVAAAERGDICESLACAKQACSIESQYGDDPIWSVLRRAIETIDATDDDD